MNKMKVYFSSPGDWETVTKYSERGLWSQADLGLPPARWATLGKLLCPSEPQCLCLKRAQNTWCLVHVRAC